MQIDKTAMTESRFQCWQRNFAGGRSTANTELCESYDKNSRNSGDFRPGVCFPFITVCRPFAFRYRKFAAAASCKLSDGARGARWYIEKFTVPAPAACKRNGAYTNVAVYEPVDRPTG